MKQGRYFLGTFCVVLCAIYVLIPIVAFSSAAGFTTIPLSDPGNDLVKSSNVYNLNQGSFNTTHPEVDVLSAFINNTDLIIEFNATPVVGASYTRFIYIDNNSDGAVDCLLNDIEGQVYLSKVISITDTLVWNSTSSTWMLNPAPFPALPYSINGNSLTYETVVLAIPNLAGANIGVRSVYTGESPDWYFTDDAPGLSADTGIPSFTVLLALFSIVFLIGLSFIIRRNGPLLRQGLWN